MHPHSVESSRSEPFPFAHDRARISADCDDSVAALHVRAETNCPSSRIDGALRTAPVRSGWQ